MKKLTTIQIDRELYKQLRLYCINNDKKISPFVTTLIKQAIIIKAPTSNVLRVNQ